MPTQYREYHVGEYSTGFRWVLTLLKCVHTSVYLSRTCTILEDMCNIYVYMYECCTLTWLYCMYSVHVHSCCTSVWGVMLLRLSCLYSGTAVGVVVYTGRETRSVLNTSQPRAKVRTIHTVILYICKYRHTVLIYST